MRETKPGEVARLQRALFAVFRELCKKWEGPRSLQKSGREITVNQRLQVGHAECLLTYDIFEQGIFTLKLYSLYKHKRAHEFMCALTVHAWARREHNPGEERGWYLYLETDVHGQACLLESPYSEVYRQLWSKLLEVTIGIPHFIPLPSPK